MSDSNVGSWPTFFYYFPHGKNKVVLDYVKMQISVIMLVKKQLLKLKGAYLNKNKEADI